MVFLVKITQIPNTATGKARVRPVAMMDKDGNILKTFDSIIQAERELGIHHSNISDCCLGKYKTSGGYKWKYLQKKKKTMKEVWKSAEGTDLPIFDREVIALLDNGKVVFAHRPPEYWDGKDIVTGKVTRHYPKIYDKGGWNIPDVKYWLDVELPKEMGL